MKTLKESALEDQVVANLFRILFVYHERVCLLAVEETIQILTREWTTFGLKFVTGFVQECNILSRKTSPTNSRFLVTLFRWSCCVLKTLPEQTLPSETFDLVAGQQNWLLSLIVDDSKRNQPISFRFLDSLQAVCFLS